MTKRSLLIGRFQPFGPRHELIVRKLLDEGRKVGIGIRDTALHEDNPYSFLDRATMVAETMRQFWMNGDVEVFKVPDFDEMVIGRKLGWEIREIELDEDEIPASGTVLRNRLMQPLWISGRPNSGKTTLAHAIQRRLGKTAVVLDGDSMRRTIGADLDLSDEGRMDSNHRIAALAQELRVQGLSVICATVSPTPEIRVRIYSILNPRWVWTQRRDETPEPLNYTPPKGAIGIWMDEMEPDEAATVILERLSQE